MSSTDDESGGSLVCARCAKHYPLSERFCPRCGLPLTYAVGNHPEPAELSEAEQQARKIDPRYAEGQLLLVAGARNQPEAELIQGILLEEGIPSLLRRTRGFDVPDMLAAGPRDVMVPESGAKYARELLQRSAIDPAPDTPTRDGSEPRTVLLVVGAGLLVVAAVVALLSLVAGV